MAEGMFPKQLPNKHPHKVSQMNTPLETEISIVYLFHLRAAVCWGFTAEAADNMPPAAAAEEPGEGEQLQDRTREACWSCDRSTCPWPRPPGVRNELQQLGSCTERSYHCCGENTRVTLSTNSKYGNVTIQSRAGERINTIIYSLLVKCSCDNMII